MKRPKKISKLRKRMAETQEKVLDRFGEKDV